MRFGVTAQICADTVKVSLPELPNQSSLLPLIATMLLSPDSSIHMISPAGRKQLCTTSSPMKLQRNLAKCLGPSPKLFSRQ